MEEIKLPDATARKSGSTPDNGRKASIFRKSSRLLKFDLIVMTMVNSTDTDTIMTDDSN
jgi:hypothetical protein